MAGYSAVMGRSEAKADTPAKPKAVPVARTTEGPTVTGTAIAGAVLGAAFGAIAAKGMGAKVGRTAAIWGAGHAAAGAGLASMVGLAKADTAPKAADTEKPRSKDIRLPWGAIVPGGERDRRRSNYGMYLDNAAKSNAESATSPAHEPSSGKRSAVQPEQRGTGPIEVAGYTRADGTVVVGYKRELKR